VYKDDAEKKAAIQRLNFENMAAMAAARQRGEVSYGRWFGLSNATMSNFIESLAPNVDRPIIDKTQIEGSHSFTVKWTPEAQMPAGDAPRGPSIYAALEEQLGLKLQPAKDEIELLVVDHAAKTPTSN
jgi:uncharacterized protein (TIGR03435 family)